MSVEIINARPDPSPGGLSHSWGQGEGQGRGRPSKLTPERHSRVLNEISKGTPIELVAAKCDIHEDTFYEWMNRGEKDRLHNKVTIFSVFSEQVLIARDKYEADLASKWIEISTKPQVKTRKVYKERVLDDGSVVKYLDSETVEEVGSGDWQGIAEYMSRRYRRWKKKENIEHSGLDGGPIEVQSTVAIESFPAWWKQATVVIGSGVQIDCEMERMLQEYFEAKFLEAEKLVGSGATNQPNQPESTNQLQPIGLDQSEPIIEMVVESDEPEPNRDWRPAKRVSLDMDDI